MRKDRSPHTNPHKRIRASNQVSIAMFFSPSIKFYEGSNGAHAQVLHAHGNQLHGNARADSGWDCAYIHLSNVLTDHFSNSISEKTTKGILMKFSQCPFKNILHRLPLSNRGIYIQIIHVRRKAIFTFYGTCIACVNNISFQIGYFT